MNQNVWTRLDLIARGLFPFALALLLIMAAVVPLRITGLSAIVPSLGLVAVYYWVIYRPDLMPIWVVFVIGLFQDLLGGGLLGVNVTVLLLLCAAISLQRRFLATGSFALVWAVFIALGAGAFLLSALLHSVILGSLIELRPVFFQYLTTVAVYPCLAWMFAQAQRTVVR